MRLFTAIDIPDDVCARLRALLAKLRPSAKIAWSPAENLHVTTKFIGEWPEDRLQEMKNVIKGAGSPGAVQIALRGLGWFPNDRHPRVLWAGIESGPELATLARATEDAVAALGVPNEDRKFSPHLTLARIRERVPLDALRRAVEVEPADFGSFTATSFYLYLSKAGRYTKLAEFVLA